MKKLLQLKHWQLFIIIFAIPMILQTGFSVYMFVNMFAMTMKNPEDPQIIIDGISSMTRILPIILVIVTTLQFLWQYTLGTNLYKKIPEGVNLNLRLFKLSLIVPIVYLLVICFIMINISITLDESSIPNPFLILIIPFNFLTILCVVYCYYFSAKAFKSIELQRNVVFNDFIAEFFLIWFFFIGVWILQPRINKIFEQQ
ncbi:hypothetical protein ACLI1A_06745 [Flavobacterium sp. RHBU_3]|uniref:hypothetical protein n=1 Tax=Flavobacterium sp. RHBU_3 TaxID=3391184 RepID=UPI003984F7BC